MKLEYVGPHDGVDVVLPNGREISVKRGATADFPEEVANSLLSQGTSFWKKQHVNTTKEEE